MQRSAIVVRNYLSSRILNRRHTSRPCNVFINHRGIDTKRNVAGLLYDHLLRMRLRPFLDRKNLNPGDKLLEEIQGAIRSCKVGIAVFSPRYCESFYCLHELALLVENKKKIIPIFCDVKPSELRVENDGSCTDKELQRLNWALGEAKFTVGLTFDSVSGDWSELLRKTSTAVINNMIEAAGEDMLDI